MDRTTRKRGPLTDEQKEHRRDHNLCMYCGDPEHGITECFRRPTKRKTVPDMTNPENPVSPKHLHWYAHLGNLCTRYNLLHLANLSSLSD